MQVQRGKIGSGDVKSLGTTILVDCCFEALPSAPPIEPMRLASVLVTVPVLQNDGQLAPSTILLAAFEGCHSVSSSVGPAVSLDACIVKESGFVPSVVADVCPTPSQMRRWAVNGLRIAPGSQQEDGSLKRRWYRAGERSEARRGKAGELEVDRLT